MLLRIESSESSNGTNILKICSNYYELIKAIDDSRSYIYLSIDKMGNFDVIIINLCTVLIVFDFISFDFIR